jgi:hypothetical protein
MKVKGGTNVELFCTERFAAAAAKRFVQVGLSATD